MVLPAVCTSIRVMAHDALRFNIDVNKGKDAEHCTGKYYRISGHLTGRYTNYKILISRLINIRRM